MDKPRVSVHNFSVLLLLLIQFANANVIHPGEARVVRLVDAGGEEARVFCRGTEVPAQRGTREYVAVIAEPYASERKPFSCQLKRDADVLAEVAFEVKEKAYPVERLRVPARLVQLSPRDQALYDAEQAALKPAYANPLPTAQFTKPFHRPLAGRVTSPYGIRRILNGVTKTEHNGIDFRAPIGTKIPVANAGRVVFTGRLMRSGNLVVVDHGLGVFTQYHHLSKILVKEGDVVDREQVIGLSGDTGRASGPHLHWAARVQGEFVDGLSLIEATEAW